MKPHVKPKVPSKDYSLISLLGRDFPTGETHRDCDPLLVNGNHHRVTALMKWHMVLSSNPVMILRIYPRASSYGMVKSRLTDMGILTACSPSDQVKLPKENPVLTRRAEETMTLKEDESIRVPAVWDGYGRKVYVQNGRSVAGTRYEMHHLVPNLLRREGSLCNYYAFVYKLPSQFPFCCTLRSDLLPSMARGSSQVASNQHSGSPYFLPNGDHPRMILVSHSLTGPNFNTWSRSMTTALTARNKIAFIDGTLPRPDSGHLLYNAWIRYNSMVTSWILNSVSKEIVDSLLYIETVSKIWQDLRDRFHQSNGPRIFQIKKHPIALNQGAMDVNSYFTRLKILWDEYKDFQPLPPCQKQRTITHGIPSLSEIAPVANAVSAPAKQRREKPICSHCALSFMQATLSLLKLCGLLLLFPVFMFIVIMSPCLQLDFGIIDSPRHKFSPRASPCIFLGYLPGYKGYKLLDLDTNTQFISRDVVFHESKFPFHNTPSPIDSTHIRHPPYLQDYHCYSTIVESSSTSHPLSQVLSYHKLSSTHTTFVCALSSHVEPTSYAQVADILEWQIAMADELRALKNNKTWSVVFLLHGKHPVGCKWVYKIKYLANGSIKRYNALDYLDTFSSVAKLVIVKVLLNLAAIHS
ncbi:hypothetical protein AAG906_007018 [Vitis piasezkii]